MMKNILSAGIILICSYELAAQNIINTDRPDQRVDRWCLQRFLEWRQKHGDGKFIFKSNGIDSTTGISSVRGLTFFCTSGMTYSVGSKLGYENVIFPCTVKVIYTTGNSFNTASIECSFELEIKTPGIWEIKHENCFS